MTEAAALREQIRPVAGDLFFSAEQPLHSSAARIIVKSRPIYLSNSIFVFRMTCPCNFLTDPLQMRTQRDCIMLLLRFSFS
jgi:hypothetical protein